MPTETIIRSATRKWSLDWDRIYCNRTEHETDVIVWGNFPRDIYIKSRVWDRTPGYRALVAAKKPLPDNGYSYTETRVCDQVFNMKATQQIGVCTPGSTNERTRIYYDKVQGVYLPYQQGTRTLSDSSVREKLIDRAKGSEWSVPVFVGEGRQTVNLVLNAARTLGSAYRNLRRGRFGDALTNLGIQGDESARRRYNRQYGRDPTRAAGNAWLGLTYGWTPLLNDVYNSAETLAETTTYEENRVIRVTAVARRFPTQIDRTFRVSSSPQIEATRTLITEESVRGVWRCKPTSWNVAGSFGLLNPAQVAWELLPFSFVVDWFLPIGRYLEGLDVPMRFDHLGGSIGYRRKVRTLYDAWSWDGLPTECSSVYETSYVTLNRTPLSGPPTLGLDSIVFEPKIGAARVTSAISLLSQIFRR